MTASSKTPASSTPADLTLPAATRCVVSLEVVRGLTQFPTRPFPIGRFLIGAGEQCDVRLGGTGIPALHSIFVTDADGALVEAVAPAPALRVNGEVRQSARVLVGDTFAIGGFEFAVKPVESAAAAEMSTSRQTAPNLVERDDELALKSAVELVELIEAEVHHVEDFQSRRQLGAEALLQAALRLARSEESDIDDSETVDANDLDDAVFPAYRPSVAPIPKRLPLATSGETEGAETRHEVQQPVEELEEIVARLNSYSEQLEQRSKRLEEHEAGYLEASLELLKAQQRLADHLQSLQQQIEGLEVSKSKSLRASA